MTYKNIEQLPLILSIPEIADILRINKTKAYELAREEDFPSIYLGRRIIVPKEEFLNWLEEKSQGGN
ncbi:MAG: helix-turn-helix domain-containing protein [Candidatus Woesearchaeota archaeon]